MKLPEGFKISVNLKQSIANAAGLLIFAKLALGITNPWLLVAVAVFGAAGGSINDIAGWLRNKDAIVSFKPEDKK